MFALECKEWWCEKILTGKKTIEVRQYQPPPAFFNSPVLLIATTGTDGQASLGDVVHAGDAAAKVVGSVTFSSQNSMKYLSSEAFEQDVEKHRVAAADGPYVWKDGVEMYGWAVEAYKRYDGAKPVPEMKRELRSIYRVVEGAVTENVRRGAEDTHSF